MARPRVARVWPACHESGTKPGMDGIPKTVQALALLVASNVFITFASYGHLGSLPHKPTWTAIRVSWGIGFFA